MAVNLCQAHHCSVIACSQVAADGYEVDNLLGGAGSTSGGASFVGTNSRGFRAEYFIKPPVDITLRFSAPVEISHVVLGLRLGSLQVTGIEIWTKQPSDGSDVFCPVGKCLTASDSTLCFVNNAYRPRGQFRQFPLSVPDDGASRYLRGKSYSHLESVDALLVRITRTANSCTPALSFLEVWGQSGRNCDPQVANSMIEAEKKARTASAPRASSPVPASANMSKQEDSANVSPLDSGIEVPQDFIDPISCEFMALPLLLPSGQTVDRSTLDKYLEAEASWGRPPSDPFTGLPFRKGQEPVPNVALKARIDQFLIKNEDLMKNVPRTLGRKPIAPAPQDEACRPESATKSVGLSPNPSERNSSKAVGPNTSAVFDPSSTTKRARLFEAEESAPSTTNQSHDRRLSESLDSSLKSSLSGLRSFTRPVWTAELAASHEQSAPCSMCSRSGEAIVGGKFSLPCGHFLCRDCLIVKKERNALVCDLCRNTFTSADVIRSHTK